MYVLSKKKKKKKKKKDRDIEISKLSGDISVFTAKKISVYCMGMFSYCLSRANPTQAFNALNYIANIHIYITKTSPCNNQKTLEPPRQDASKEYPQSMF